MNKIPKRWLDYKPYGEVIEGTKIVAFKVPLKEAMSKCLKPEQRFTITMLLEAIPRLKYVIDLTNTDRYYNKNDFTEAGVKYTKITVPGKVVPPQYAVKQFFEAMDEYMSACGEEEIIGVHCTHGVNRTGYLICRYLIQQLGWEYNKSVEAFEAARGHQIERQNYVDSLKHVQQQETVDTSNMSLNNDDGKQHPMRNPNQLRCPRFPKDRPFQPPRFAFYGPPPGLSPMPPPPLPGLGPMPPPPPAGLGPMPPPPPPVPSPALSPLQPPPPRAWCGVYAPRFRYGPPPMPSRMPPPHLPPPPPPRGPGYPARNFPPRLPGPPRLSTVRSLVHKRRLLYKKSLRIYMRPKGPDFTADTFEENLSTNDFTRRSIRQRQMISTWRPDSEP